MDSKGAIATAHLYEALMLHNRFVPQEELEEFERKGAVMRFDMLWALNRTDTFGVAGYGKTNSVRAVIRMMEAYFSASAENRATADMHCDVHIDGLVNVKNNLDAWVTQRAVVTLRTLLAWLLKDCIPNPSEWLRLVVDPGQEVNVAAAIRYAG